MFEVLPAKTIVHIEDIVAVYVDEDFLLGNDGAEKVIVYNVYVVTRNFKTRFFSDISAAQDFPTENDAREFLKNFIAQHAALGCLTFFPSGNAINISYIEHIYSFGYKETYEIKAGVGSEPVYIYLAKGNIEDYEDTLNNICQTMNAIAYGLR